LRRRPPGEVRAPTTPVMVTSPPMRCSNEMGWSRSSQASAPERNGMASCMTGGMFAATLLRGWVDTKCPRPQGTTAISAVISRSSALMARRGSPVTAANSETASPATTATPNHAAMGPDSASEMPGMMTAEQMNSWRTLGLGL
jgi:hypothetical protein